MRKLDLTDYSFGLDNENTFSVRPSIAAILFNEEKLDGREIIRRDELAQKVESCPEDTILIEESEWTKIVNGLKATDLKPHGRGIVEFVKRVLDAPVVDVKEK